MRFSRVGTVAAIATLAGLALAALALATAKDPTEGSHAATAAAVISGPSSEVAEAEAAIVRTNLAGRLEVALGEDFGGVWFEPSTARLNVGVISPESRRTAEAAAAQVGLEDVVAATSVRSTWSALEAAQEQWNRRLSRLLEPGLFSTSLAPDENSVQIELVSSVPPSKRAVVEEEAAAATVASSVEVASSPRFELEPWVGRCAKFAKFKAYCNPALVAGVSIDDEEESKGEGDCTAGPTMTDKFHTSKTVATETFLLTAGHCITGEGKVEKNWHAFEKEGERKKIGTAVTTMEELGVDAGVIQVEKEPWMNPNDPTPISPTIAQWSKEEETDPFPVIDKTSLTLNLQVCYSGQRSGTQCGKVTKVDEAILFWTNLVVIELETGEGGKGDSGAPAFPESSYKTESKGYVGGIVVGGKEEQSKTVYVQTLSFALETLEKEKGYALELLTESNKIRHPVFTAAKYTATLTGEDSSADKFTAFGATITCKKRTFAGSLSEPGTEEVADSIELTPSYSECTEDEGRSVKVTINECKYKITLSEKVEDGHYKGEVDLVCPEGKPGIEFDFYASHEDLTEETNPCEMTMPPQTGLQSLTLTNSEGNIVVDKGAVEGIKFEMETNDCFCPGRNEGETSSGVYDLAEALTIEGEKEEKEVGIDMGGG